MLGWRQNSVIHLRAFDYAHLGSQEHHDTNLGDDLDAVLARTDFQLACARLGRHVLLIEGCDPRHILRRGRNCCAEGPAKIVLEYYTVAEISAPPFHRKGQGQAEIDPGTWLAEVEDTDQPEPVYVRQQVQVDVSADYLSLLEIDVLAAADSSSVANSLLVELDKPEV